jgi:hypothetical protein
MHVTRKSLVITVATAALVAGSVGTAQAAVVRGGIDGAGAAATAHVRAVSGAFAYEMTATPAGITDVEHFGTVQDGHGSSSRPAVEPGEIRSMGHVAGGTSFANGVSGAHLSGVAGDDVTSVTVVPASGAPVPATLDGGIWAAAWQGDPEADGGRAEVRFTTKDGKPRTTTTDDIDWIAAEQRAADRY